LAYFQERANILAEAAGLAADKRGKEAGRDNILAEAAGLAADKRGKEAGREASAEGETGGQNTQHSSISGKPLLHSCNTILTLL
jgi:hypothetical protein